MNLQAFKKHFLKDRDIAREIKTEFDKRHGLNWHCVVGTSYGNSSLSLYILDDEIHIS